MSDPLVQDYRFADVLLSRSEDNGKTWQDPIRVNDDPLDNRADQFQPALAVDKEGQVFVLFYDRREDPRNFMLDVFLAVSRDKGGSFRNEKLTIASFSPIVAQDFLLRPAYMGDYIGLAVDATGRNGGVIAAWGDNQMGDANVRVERR